MSEATTLDVTSGQREEPETPFKRLESRLEEIGIQKYHYFLLVTCGLCHLADAAEIMGMSFAIQDSAGMIKDLGGDEHLAAHLSSILFVGMLVGGAITGSLGDVVGRRRALFLTMAVNSLFGASSAAVHSKGWLLFTRFMSGVGAGGSIPVNFTYFIEFFSHSTRERFIVYLATTWPLGTAYAAGMGYIALPEARAGVFGIQRWRVFFLLLALPSFLGATLLLAFASDSPKYLTSKGKHEKCSKVLKRISGGQKSKMNYKPLESNRGSVNYPMKATSPVATGKDSDNSNSSEVLLIPKDREVFTASKTPVERLKTWLQTVGLFFSRKYIRTTISLAILWFTLSFSFYGWTAFQPSYASSELGDKVYFEALLGAGMSILGSIASSFTIPLFGSKVNLFVSSILESVVMFAFAILGKTDETKYYILWATFSLFSCPMWNALDVIQPEAFPTELRATAFGFMAIFGRLGGFGGSELFGFFKAGSLPPVFLCSGIFVIGGVSVLFLPSKRGKAID